MKETKPVAQLPQEEKDEKKRVAYALNLCAVSISQIIDSKDLMVLKQERELILNNINLQNFVKHPALFEVLREILNTITYLEIQAGDLSFIEREYKQKLKDAIWTAMPNSGALFGMFTSGSPIKTAIGLAATVGTGYMNYRRNKSQYDLGEEKSKWELRRHELEQLYGLRAKLFETAWKLSDDFAFPEEYRLTQTELSRFSEALLEEDPLKRHERLDVMSSKFEAFPPFWYYKGNAAREVAKSEKYKDFAADYEKEAIAAYEKHDEKHFEFLREDVMAASCCLEHISLLEANDRQVKDLLEKAERLAGTNYDVLQQCVLVYLRFGEHAFDSCIRSLREMIVNGYNVDLNAILLSRIYTIQKKDKEYQKLRAIAGNKNVLLQSDDEKEVVEYLAKEIMAEFMNEYSEMIKDIKEDMLSLNIADRKLVWKKYEAISVAMRKELGSGKSLAEAMENMEKELKKATYAQKPEMEGVSEAGKKVLAELGTVELSFSETMKVSSFIEMMKEDAKQP
jgi:hypothetical protein